MIMIYGFIDWNMSGEILSVPCFLSKIGQFLLMRKEKRYNS